MVNESVKPVVPTEADMEKMVFDGLWYPQCPYCGAENTAEPDAESVYCEGCDRHYRLERVC